MSYNSTSDSTAAAAVGITIIVISVGCGCACCIACIIGVVCLIKRANQPSMIVRPPIEYGPPPAPPRPPFYPQYPGYGTPSTMFPDHPPPYNHWSTPMSSVKPIPLQSLPTASYPETNPSYQPVSASTYPETVPPPQLNLSSYAGVEVPNSIGQNDVSVPASGPFSFDPIPNRPASGYISSNMKSIDS